MSTDTPQPPPQPQPASQTTIPNREADFQRFKNYAAISFLVAAPVLIALPPRKLDHLTVLLTGAFCASANHITRERTGRSILERIEDRVARSSTHNPNPSFLGSGDLPSDKAREIQAKVRAAREARMQEEGVGREEMERLKAQKEQDRSVFDRFWMGNEKGGWKERRLREEQKALDEGRGYGDLIKDHIWEVWTWGEKKKEEKEDDGK
ncbi:hypothetical protein ASPSYDRAFT_140287 [Aspergillus sydowii CBS 593.65]|uniref:Rhomboid family membrane protein n=1 Tax=Aspergillus sydowii CBS 593.65 TaxID=1036612 RepID=A0A1L9U0N9_9EURO|nr:uncharacterized protein ASPSYDRAFT_140287 [Aspergillus sydowii CBS 593.65]OJJ65103.1 hypothetical protein ASPSYDRAFT_140287 [Aspergillus sydowii CBS 593.65]